MRIRAQGVSDISLLNVLRLPNFGYYQDKAPLDQAACTGSGARRDIPS